MTDAQQQTVERIDLGGGWHAYRAGRRCYIGNTEHDDIFHIDVDYCEPEFRALLAALAVQPGREPAVPEELRRLYGEVDTSFPEYRGEAWESFKTGAAHWVSSLLSVPPQPDPRDTRIKLPTSEREAEMMQKLGYAWLRDNAPHRLTDPAREKEAAEADAAALRTRVVELERAIASMAEQIANADEALSRQATVVAETTGLTWRQLAAYAQSRADVAREPAVPEELRRLNEAATPGEWSTGGIFDPDGLNLRTTIWGPALPGFQSGVWISQNIRVPDGKLAAAAVNYVRSLLSAAAPGQGEG